MILCHPNNHPSHVVISSLNCITQIDLNDYWLPNKWLLISWMGQHMPCQCQYWYYKLLTNLRNDVGEAMHATLDAWAIGKIEVELFVIQKLWGHLSESNWWAEISNLQSTWNIASYPDSFSRRKRKWAWVRGNVEHTFTCTKHHQYKRCVLWHLCVD